MENPEEILNLAEQRLKEAEILLENDMSDGAFYLAGYSVELTLKAKLCERFCVPTLFKSNKELGIQTPEISSNIKKMVQTHNLNELILVCGLHYKLLDFKQSSVVANKNVDLIFKKWKVDIRYKNTGLSKNKVKQIINFLKNNKGILQWIKDS